jgi:hypothetical protein
MRTLIISLAAAGAIAASAAPAFAQPPDPCHAPAHVAAIVGHPSLAADVAAQSAAHRAAAVSAHAQPGSPYEPPNPC